MTRGFHRTDSATVAIVAIVVVAAVAAVAAVVAVAVAVFVFVPLYPVLDLEEISVLRQVVLGFQQLALAALGRAGLLFAAVGALAAAAITARARLLAVALSLHAVTGVARGPHYGCWHAQGDAKRHTESLLLCAQRRTCAGCPSWEQRGARNRGVQARLFGGFIVSIAVCMWFRFVSR